MTTPGVIDPSFLLLVEDYDDDRDLMRRALRQVSLESCFAIVEHGQEAIDFLDARKASGLPLPRAVITDLHMPVLDGLELTERIRASPDYGWLPVIVFSNSRKPADAGRAYAAGANSYVPKPTSIRRCTEVMAAVATFWLTVNRSA